MQRVAVVGSGGAGKSTFARTLGGVTGIPVIHLDENYWNPGWSETPRDEFAQIHGALLAQERWIVDGHYAHTFDLRFARADTVIVLAPPRRVCIYRVLKRVVLNWHRDVQAPGCPEHLDLTFLRWLWDFPHTGRPALAAALSRHEDHLEVVYLTSSAATRRYLARLADH
jgi:adenylate kinase family enzyme